MCADPPSLNKLKIEGLNDLEKDLWRSLQRVGAAKSTALQKSFEKRMQVRHVVGFRV